MTAPPRGGVLLRSLTGIQEDAGRLSAGVADHFAYESREAYGVASRVSELAVSAFELAFCLGLDPVSAMLDKREIILSRCSGGDAWGLMGLQPAVLPADSAGKGTVVMTDDGGTEAMPPKDGRPIPLPLTPRSAAEALEDLLPGHAEASLGCGPVVAALVDRLEPGTPHPLTVPLPEAGMPVMGLAGESLETEIVLDTWVGKGTVLLADGRYVVIALLLELERRPGDDCWRARVRSREVHLPLAAYLEELDLLAA